MSTAKTIGQVGETTPVKTRFVGAYYVLTLATCAFVLFFHGKLAFTADVITGIFFVGMTAYMYGLSRTANRRSGHKRER